MLHCDDGGWVSVHVQFYWSGECVCSWASLSPSLPMPRKPISGASSKALSRLRRYLENCKTVYRVFITLTYPAVFPSVPQSKVHLKRFLRHLMSLSGVTSACWVLEWQRRGAPHYHVAVDSAWIPHKWTAAAWFRATNRKSSLTIGTQTAAVRGSRAEIGRYLSKELSKTLQKQASSEQSSSGRVWGVVGCSMVHELEAATLIMQRLTAQTLSEWIPWRVSFTFPSGFWMHGVDKLPLVVALERTGAYVHGSHELERPGL